MNEETETILKRLCRSEISIEEASKMLNVSEDDVWDLLDQFDYCPSGEEVVRACEIEEETWKNLEKDLEKSKSSADQDMN
ncbi:MAG: hypothetical protein HXS48_08065 [Theionarchaea archaeon]|nr:MAG: hypothetical protein AYK19_10975 [Theionarchaea archaeon DG-70-1]MBU7026882.1 hypothetical protein [Theionarchaea archaeon]